ncbi:hypothetical protein [Streptomyces sp. B8F3]|uniref:hypothetical protein n=1 Tax=unclassified Streptomyces TaxID=2593676 RepID=UPI00325E6334
MVRPSRSAFYGVFTATALVVALGLCVAWLVRASDGGRWEPAIQVPAILAAMSGVIAERRAAARDREKQTLRALAEELVKNTAILDDPRFAPLDPARPVHRVFPRPVLSATDATLVSGVLAGREHQELLALLHKWRDAVREFNRRLDLAELRSFVVEADGPELLRIDRDLHRDGGHLDETRRLRGAIEELLRTRYRDKPEVVEALAGDRGTGRAVEPGR